MDWFTACEQSAPTGEIEVVADVDDDEVGDNVVCCCCCSDVDFVELESLDDRNDVAFIFVEIVVDSVATIAIAVVIGVTANILADVVDPCVITEVRFYKKSLNN